MAATLQSKVPRFLFATFLVSWAIILCFVSAGGRWNTLAAYFATYAFMAGPLVAALHALKGLPWPEVRQRLGLPFRFNGWLWAAWALPFALAGLTLAFSLMMPGAEFSFGAAREKAALFQQLPFHPALLYLAWAIVAGPTVNALIALGEEAGWRGFLYAEWGNRGFWKCSFSTGAVWGLWHLPLILQGHNYPDHRLPGVFMMIVVCLLLSPLFTWVRIRSGSVLAAAVAHGTFNAVSGLAVVFVKGGSDLTVGVTGFAGMGALLVLNVCLLAGSRGRL
jgi:uncharacterized protein